MRSLYKPLVDVGEGEGLQYHGQRQAKRQVAHHCAECGVEHLIGSETQKGEPGIDHALLRQNDLPGKDPHQIAREERNDQEEDRPASFGFTGLEGQEIAGREGQLAGTGGGQQCHPQGEEVGIPEEAAGQHALPVGELEGDLHAIVLHQEERHRHHEDQRTDEEQSLPNDQWQPPGHRVVVWSCGFLRRHISLAAWFPLRASSRPWPG